MSDKEREELGELRVKVAGLQRRHQFLKEGLQAIQILVTQMPKSQVPVLSLVDTMLQHIEGPPF